MKGKSVSDREFIEIGSRVMADMTRLEVNIDIRSAWLLVSLLQLASRHPGISQDMDRFARQIAMQFQNSVTERHPEAAPLFQLGWNKQLDRRIKRK